MKKFSFIYPLFAVVLIGSLVSAYSTGRAAAGFANTGAPGDDEISPNTPKTCAYCHSAGQFSPTVSFAFYDSANTKVVTKYVPGRVHTIRFTIKAGTGVPKAYGFQMIGLRKTDSAEYKGFLAQAQQTDQYVHIVLDANNKRTYAEHPTPNPNNTFNVKWRAPAAKSGTIVFYGAGNAVNGDGDQTGDGASSTSVELSEGTSGVNELSLVIHEFTAFPNPVNGMATLSLNSGVAQEVTLMISDLSGRTVYSSTWSLHLDENNRTLDLSQLAKGVYLATLTGSNGVLSRKVVKI